MKFCPYCGKQMEGFERFCGGCGSVVETATSQTQLVVEPSFNSQKQAIATPKKSKKKMAIIICVCIAVIALIAAAVFVMMNRSSDPPLSPSEKVIKQGLKLGAMLGRDVLEDDSFNISSFGNFYFLTKETEDVFGLPGKFRFTIANENEPVGMVMWTCTATGLTSVDADAFVESICGVYGEPTTESDDGTFYVWDDDTYSILMHWDPDEGTLSLVLNKNTEDD